MVLLLRKLYLYFTKDPEAVHYFPGGGGGGGGGGGSNFFPGGGGGGGWGPNVKFYRNTYMYLLFSRGECPDPLSPSGSTRGQCHHNGTIFITVRPLTIIVRP